jgi:hypothetical protein
MDSGPEGRRWVQQRMVCGGLGAAAPRWKKNYLFFSTYHTKSDQSAKGTKAARRAGVVHNRTVQHLTDRVQHLTNWAQSVEIGNKSLTRLNKWDWRWWNTVCGRGPRHSLNPKGFAGPRARSAQVFRHGVPDVLERVQQTYSATPYQL